MSLADAVRQSPACVTMGAIEFGQHFCLFGQQLLRPSR
jgi:hypothetical protein